MAPPTITRDATAAMVGAGAREPGFQRTSRAATVSGLGQPPFDPRMMVALLLHGYASERFVAAKYQSCREREAIS